MIITGFQPTGTIHIGNLLGAIKPLVELQKTNETIMVMIADYHAITSGHDPKMLSKYGDDLVATLYACGLTSPNTFIFRQSDVPAHTELAWILMCTASRVGWLNRMIQFKEKSEVLGEHSEGPSVGLYAYPVLQAADILLYGADRVPVGDDQSQHLNLAVDIAEKFNREFGNVFVIPKPLVGRVGRVMSLIDGSKKMSKSDSNPMSRINLSDDDDTIRAKFKKATSDTELVPYTVSELEGRLELTNLLTIYAAMTDQTIAESLELFGGGGYGALKPAVADAVIEHLRPIRERLAGAAFRKMRRLEANGAEKANEIAKATLFAVRRTIGVS